MPKIPFLGLKNRLILAKSYILSFELHHRITESILEYRVALLGDFSLTSDEPRRSLNRGSRISAMFNHRGDDDDDDGTRVRRVGSLSSFQPNPSSLS